MDWEGREKMLVYLSQACIHLILFSVLEEDEKGRWVKVFFQHNVLWVNKAKGKK